MDVVGEIRWMRAVCRVVVLGIGPLMLAAIGATPFAWDTVGQGDQPATAIQFPRDYRSWQHVRTVVVGRDHRSFASRGGIHHYYANAAAVEGYRTGRFPNGSVVVDEGVLTTDGAGESRGIVFEGDRRSLDVMVKNDRLYADTAGWGFEHFEGQEAAGQLDAKGRTQCYQCHARSKDRDHVFSAIRVAKFAPPPRIGGGAGGADLEPEGGKDD